MVISWFNPLVIDEGEKPISLFQELIPELGNLLGRGFEILLWKDILNKGLGRISIRCSKEILPRGHVIVEKPPRNVTKGAKRADPSQRRAHF